MTTSTEQGSVRARHLFRRYVQTRAQYHPITPDDLPAYQAQTREVLEQHGNDYTEQWLQTWVESAQADLDRLSSSTDSLGQDGKADAAQGQRADDGITPLVARILACKGHIA